MVSKRESEREHCTNQLQQRIQPCKRPRLYALQLVSGDLQDLERRQTAEKILRKTPRQLPHLPLWQVLRAEVEISQGRERVEDPVMRKHTERAVHQKLAVLPFLFPVLMALPQAPQAQMVSRQVKCVQVREPIEHTIRHVPNAIPTQVDGGSR